MNKIDRHIAMQMFRLRKDRNLTQKELASMLGLSRVAVVYMEIGRQSFSTKTIYLLCCIFNISPSELFPPVKNVKIVKIKKQVIKVIKEGKFSVKGLPKV